MREVSQPDPAEVAGDVPDTALVARARAGDLDAYDELVLRHHRKIYGLVYNMTSNKEDAEDLVQDIFHKAYTVLHKFKGDASFYTWIYRIAVNRTINYVKRRNKRSGVSLDDVDAGVERDPAYVELSEKAGTPFRDCTLNELQERLNKALMTLSEKHRTVVVLHDIQGVPHDEIAKMLKVSSGTVRSRLFYARKLLQAELAEFAP